MCTGHNEQPFCYRLYPQFSKFSQCRICYSCFATKVTPNQERQPLLVFPIFRSRTCGSIAKFYLPHCHLQCQPPVQELAMMFSVFLIFTLAATVSMFADPESAVKGCSFKPRTVRRTL